MLKYVRHKDLKKKKLSRFDLEIINLIKMFRISRGVKQNVLADALGMSQANYCKLERGELRAIAVGELDTVARELNVPISEIFRAVSRM